MLRMGGLIAFVAIVTMLLMGALPESSSGDETKQQKIVYLHEDGSSSVLTGDPESAAGDRRRILPSLLNDGWRVVEIERTKSNIVAVVLLEK